MDGYEAVGSQGVEWLFIDDAGADRLGSKGGNYLPGAGADWASRTATRPRARACDGYFLVLDSEPHPVLMLHVVTSRPQVHLQPERAWTRRLKRGDHVTARGSLEVVGSSRR